MDKHLDLGSAYELLERMTDINLYEKLQGRTAALYDASWRYSCSTPSILNESPRILLGTDHHVFRDSLGVEITAKLKSGEEGKVCYGRRIYLYAGPDQSGSIKAFIVFEPTLVLHFGTYSMPDRSVERIIDGSVFGSLELNLVGGGQAWIQPEQVASTVTLHLLEDEDPSKDPVLWAFIDANPDYANQEFTLGEGCIAKDYDIHAVTLDALDYLGDVLERAYTSEGVLAFSDIVILSARYGSGKLVRLAGVFLQPWVPFDRSEAIKQLTGGKFTDGKLLKNLEPPGGWMHGERHPHFWSAVDIWWLMAKSFKTNIEMAYENASRSEQSAFELIMNRFETDEVALSDSRAPIKRKQ